MRDSKTSNTFLNVRQESAWFGEINFFWRQLLVLVIPNLLLPPEEKFLPESDFDALHAYLKNFFLNIKHKSFKEKPMFLDLLYY